MVENYKNGFLNGKKDFLEQVKDNDLSFTNYPTLKKDDEYSIGYYDGFVLYHRYYMYGIDVLNVKVDQESEVNYAYKERTKVR